MCDADKRLTSVLQKQTESWGMEKGQLSLVQALSHIQLFVTP